MKRTSILPKRGAAANEPRPALCRKQVGIANPSMMNNRCWFFWSSGGTGRRKGLKNLRPKGRAGSNPASTTASFWLTSPIRRAVFTIHRFFELKNRETLAEDASVGEERVSSSSGRAHPF